MELSSSKLTLSLNADGGEFLGQVLPYKLNVRIWISDSAIPSDTLYNKKSDGVTVSGNENEKSYSPL